MCDAGLERVGAPRQRACQLPQGLPGCATNCSNKGDVMQSCSVDQRLWQLGNARWQIRQSARAARHRALHRHVLYGSKGGGSKARSPAQKWRVINSSLERNAQEIYKTAQVGRSLLQRSRWRHYPSARKSMPLVSGSCQTSSAVREATTQPKKKNCGAGPPTAAEARG